MTTLDAIVEKLHEPSLPVGWRMVRLGEVCEIVAGQSPPGSTYRKSPEGLPFFQGKADFGLMYPIARVWCVEPNKIAHPGDILISVRAPVGPTNVADVKCCIGRGLAAIRCGEGIDREFLLAALRHLEANLAKLGSGSTFEAISRSDLEDFDIPLPLLPEQKRIVATLREQMAAVAKARAAAQARLEAATALRGSMLRTIFTGACAAQWQRVPLSSIADIVSGIQKSPNRRPVDFHRPFLTVRNVQRGSLDLAMVERFEVTPAELNRLRLCLGDILIVEGNGSVDQIGRNAIFDVDSEEWIHQNHIIRVRLNPSTTLYRFISHFLNSQPGKDQMIEKAQTTSGLYTLSSGKVGALEVPHPPLAIQHEMVQMIESRLRSFNTVSAATADEMAAIDALPAAILRRAFAGAA